jgi:4-aminobutyrate aminotransferase
VRRGLGGALEELSRERGILSDLMKIRFYPLVLEAADGFTLFDPDGNRYLDFAAAGAVMNLGYRNGNVLAAIDESLGAEWSTTSAIFAHRSQTDLARRLNQLVEGDTRVWFGTSGSEAMDMIGRYFRTASGRSRLISFVGGFHGQTGGSGALSGLPSFDDLPSAWITKVPFPDPYRCAYGPCGRDGCSLRCLDSLRGALERYSGDVAGVVLEAIQSDGGDVIPPANALAEVRRLTDAHGVWLGLDEIKVGLGRTGRMFAYEHADVTPDAVGLGKALGGGLPISAVIGRSEILDCRTGACAITLGGSPAPCAAALATLGELERLELVPRAATLGRRLLEGLDAIAAQSSIVGDVRGLGLIAGVELVEDKFSRRQATRHAARVVYRCFELGLVLIYTGPKGNVLELTPPLTITEREVDDALATLERALDDVERGRFDDAKIEGYLGW